MRKIKFRAWDKEENIMVIVDSIHFNVNGVNTFVSVTGDKALIIEGVSIGVPKELEVKVDLMQYTGLKDKKSKEIYEGDIITWLDPFSKYPKAEVLYDETTGGYRTYKGDLSHISIRPGLEVIGNIYENPELLDTKQGGTK